MSNGPWLLVFAVIVGLIWYKLGLDSVWAVAKVVVGLGFVIFIHELGHFLAAKWCDVHVQTFSIGFGPALPGCSFQRGETTYKIGAVPLGGYVNMIGEGPEADEDEDYPRSFKNKTVGQRMIIISAGVVMNVLLGCVLFIVVYYYHGVEQTPAIVGRVDPGSPMWEKGIPSGSVITDLGGIHNPVFKNLRIAVVLSDTGEKIPFTFATYGLNGEKLSERKVDLLPRLEENDPNPVVGVAPPNQLRLSARPKKDVGVLPVTRGSPAAAARAIPLKPDEVIVATTDPDDPGKMKQLPLKGGLTDFNELARRLLRLEGQKLVVHVLPKGVEDKSKPTEREVPLEGFQFNDTIIGCTDAPDLRSGPYDPFAVSELPRDPRHAGGDRRDPFVFHARLRQLSGQPMVVRVRRGDSNSTDPRDESVSGEVVNLFVPPAFHATFGMRMKMGKVAGVREDSPASRAGVHKGDELVEVVMKDERGNELYSSKDLDPERLPFKLRQAAAGATGKKTVILTVRREPSPPNSTRETHTLAPVEWEDRWDYDDEAPISAAAPLPIPQLGVAYWVLSQIVEVKDGSPADQAGLRKGDEIKEFRIKEISPYKNEPSWSDWSTLESTRQGASQYDRWALAFRILQLNDYKEIQVKVNRPGPGEEVKDAVFLTAQPDLDWPLAARGIRLIPDYKVLKANNFGEALLMGVRDTREMIVTMYLQLKSLATRRVSAKQVGGPLEMMRQGFFFAQAGNFELLLFLGMISINLAVVNFLPIPILDGGHMVFLIYEKLRGRPPAENIKIVATYIGLAMIALLMILVFYQDIRKMFGI
jgi:regulator of sigma E protease